VTTPQQQERAIKAMWEGIPRTINRRNAEKHVPRLMESLADDEMPRHLATARNGSRQALLEGNRGGDIGVLRTMV